MEQIAKRT